MNKAVVAALTDSTVLALGARGKVRPRAAALAPSGPFRLAGRVAVRSEAGAIWHEWKLAFDDGREAWLGEARGTFTLYAEAPIAPPFDALEVGAPLATELVVVERGLARRALAFGEAEAGGRSYAYADLSGRDGEAVTIDYGERVPRVFRGRAVTLRELGLGPRPGLPRFLPVTGFAKAPPKGTSVLVPLGSTGTLDRARFRVLAVLARSVEEEGERFGWQEYLLHAPAEGFRWLVVSEGHWSFVESVDPGRVRVVEEHASLDGDRYAPLSGGSARLDWAAGELPWEVSPGEESTVRDWVRAPHLLSREATEDEVAWSRASYLPPAVVAKAFGLRDLPKPRGRAPHAPRNVK